MTDEQLINALELACTAADMLSNMLGSAVVEYEGTRRLPKGSRRELRASILTWQRARCDIQELLRLAREDA